MWKLCFLILVSAFLFSCNSLLPKKGKIENDVISKIHKSCPANGSCEVQIKDVTWFDWDKMLVFPSGMTDVEINTILKKPNLLKKQFPSSDVLVFLKGEEILYTEENSRDLENHQNGDLYFSDISPNNDYQSYPNDSIFSIKQNKLNIGEYFSLQCKNCEEKK